MYAIFVFMNREIRTISDSKPHSFHLNTLVSTFSYHLFVYFTHLQFHIDLLVMPLKFCAKEQSPLALIKLKIILIRRFIQLPTTAAIICTTTLPFTCTLVHSLDIRSAIPFFIVIFVFGSVIFFQKRSLFICENSTVVRMAL